MVDGWWDPGGSCLSAQEWDKLARGPCARGTQAQPQRRAPSCVGSQQPQELSAGGTATSGGRRRESQLGGSAARWAVGRQGWLIGPTFPSRGPRLTILSQVPTPARSPHIVPAIKGITAHRRNAFTPGGLAGTSRGSLG